MKLTKVGIQAYRSLYSIEFVPRPFTVLVGPNNAGKTNLSDALEFLGNVARHGLEVAVGREGGFENLAFRRQRRTRKPVRFSFEAELTSAEDRTGVLGRRRWPSPIRISFDYAFELKASDESRDADFRVTEEQLKLTFVEESRDAVKVLGSISLSREEEKVKARVKGIKNHKDLAYLVDPFSDDAFVKYVRRVAEPTELVLNRLAFNVPISALLESLGKTRLFQLNPVECRKAGSSTPNPELERHGGNLPGVVRYMQRNHEDAWSRTLESMRKIVPGLTRIETAFTTDRRLALLFHEGGARAWNSGEVSDGTIQSLALFTCLFDPRIPLSLIEEPENSVHPWIIRSFVDACREAHEKQVLVTTHSPALIGYSTPDEIELAWRDGEGRTHVAALESLDPEASQLWATGKVDLFELIDAGWVREGVPSGMQ